MVGEQHYAVRDGQPIVGDHGARVNESASRMGSLRGKRLILIFCSVGISFLLGEIIVRAFRLGHTNTVLRYNNKILKLKPNVGFMNYEENRNWVEINNLGFHDYERQAANDKYRILFIGDSFVEGRQVDTRSLFTVQLEKRFVANGQKIETINGGVLGTGTAYQYVLWKEFFEPAIKIDHLVLCFYLGNDLVDNNSDLMFAAYPGTDHAFFVDNQGRISNFGKQPGAFKLAINFARDHSALLNTIYEGAYQLKKSRESKGATSPATKTGDAVLKPEVPRNNAGAWRATEEGTLALIKNWKTELASRNIPFDIVIIDRPGKVYNEFETEFLDKLNLTCAQDRIDCLRLKLEGTPHEVYSFDGKRLGHFNQRGHELAATELYDYFKSHHAAIFK